MKPAVDLRLRVNRLAREWYISLEEMDALEGELLLADYQPGSAERQLSDHARRVCAGCGVDGFFVWGLLGRHHHPACGARWIVSPAAYLRRNIGGGLSALPGLVFDPKAPGTDLSASCTMGCLFLVVGLPLLLLVVAPLQAVVWVARGCGRVWK